MNSSQFLHNHFNAHFKCPYCNFHSILNNCQLFNFVHCTRISILVVSPWTDKMQLEENRRKLAIQAQLSNINIVSFIVMSLEIQ